MELIELESDETLGTHVLEVVQKVVERKPNAVMGWPSGRSTIPVLNAIAESGDIDLSGVTILMMDEYALQTDRGYVDCSPGAHYSCYEWIRQHWNRVLPVGSRPTVLVPSAADPEAYEATIRELGGIDLFVVAFGSSDGHVAFNPPGTASDSRTRVIRLADSTREDNLGTFPAFAGLEEVPSFGVTVGLGTILDARRVLALAHGPNKAEIVERTLAAGRFVRELPSTCIYLSGDCQLYVSELEGDDR